QFVQRGWDSYPTPSRRPIGTEKNTLGADLINRDTQMMWTRTNDIKVNIDVSHCDGKRAVEVTINTPSHFRQNDWHVWMTARNFVHPQWITIEQSAGKLRPRRWKLDWHAMFCDDTHNTIQMFGNFFGVNFVRKRAGHDFADAFHIQFSKAALYFCR